MQDSSVSPKSHIWPEPEPKNPGTSGLPEPELELPAKHYKKAKDFVLEVK
uniref:Uncharacterized protein n=1 Tax=Meloidogyne enterolobii TaxID=390850 RepID=A0A6V7U5K9_MELEN|nr:unnamed protein product [Meloidogyne enterolobii]